MNGVGRSDEKKPSRPGSENGDRPGTVATVDERTAVPSIMDGEKGGNKNDIETAIAEQRDGLPAPIEIPDGGFKAWATVLGAWLILFSTFGMTNAYGVYQDYYVRVFLTKYSPSTIGWIGSVQLFWQFFSGIIAGGLFDAGYFYPMMIGASTLYVFAYFMLSLVKENQFYQVLLAQGFAAGIGLGFLFLPSIGVIAHHFRRRRSFAMGVVVSGSSCGGLVFPVMLNHLIHEKGFPWATRAVAFLMTGCMTIAILLMRTRLPPRSKMPAGSAPPLPHIKDLVTDTKYMITIVASFFNILGIFVPVFYLQTFAVEHGIDQNLAFYTITILNGASVVGRIIPNFIGDVWGPFNAIIVCCFACAVIILGMLGATSAGGIIAISVLYGLFSGAYISLISPVFASLANSISEIGIRMGLAFTLIAFAGLGGTPIMGALLTDQFHWSRVIGLGSGCMFFGCFMLIIARYLTAKHKKTWKV